MRQNRQTLFGVLFVCALVGVVVLAFYATPPLAQNGDVSTLQTVSFAQYSRVDLNTATQEQLCLLAGVGEAKAKCIIEYRVLVGSFASVQDLAQVSGITEQMIAEWGEQAFVS